MLQRRFSDIVAPEILESSPAELISPWRGSGRVYSLVLASVDTSRPWGYTGPDVGSVLPYMG